MRHASNKTVRKSAAFSSGPGWELPHLGSRTEAPNGHGTIRGWPPGKTLDRPVLDGSTQSSFYEHNTDNPWRGLKDPALITHPEWGPKSWRPRFFWWRNKTARY